MHRHVLTAAVFLVLAASARQASAQVGQPWIDRGYFNFNIGFESGSGELNDATSFAQFGEVGTKAVEHGVDSGALIDFSVGSRVWRNVSVGIGFHRGANDADAAASATVPHPVFFNTPRQVRLDVSGLDRSERAIHIQIGYMLPINEELSIHLFAGPSFFRVSQEVVSDLTFAEVGPPFTSVNADVAVTERKDSATGANIGADVAYKVYETPDVRLGVGMFIRYSGASADLQVLQNTVESDLGGLQVGFGARVRF